MIEKIRFVAMTKELSNIQLAEKINEIIDWINGIQAKYELSTKSPESIKEYKPMKLTSGGVSQDTRKGCGKPITDKEGTWWICGEFCNGCNRPHTHEEDHPTEKCNYECNESCKEAGQNE